MPDVTSVHEYLDKESNNSDITMEMIEKRHLTTSNNMEKKLMNGKSSNKISCPELFCEKAVHKIS